MTVAGRDSSAFLPNDAGLRQAAADGIKLWAGYFAGPGIWVGWPDSNFQRIKAAGMQSLAFCSGGSDPLACRARAHALGILYGPDVENGITDGGQAWLDTAGDAGVYGGYAVMTRRAAWHIVADYRAIPGDTWPSYLARPAGPLGWQFQGTHTEYGGSVDSSRLDDWFGGATPAPQPTHGGQMAYYMTPTTHQPNEALLWLCDDLQLGPKRAVMNPAEQVAYNANMTDLKVYNVPRFVFDGMPDDHAVVAIKAAVDALAYQLAKTVGSVPGPTGPAGPAGPAATSVTISGTFPVT